MVHQLLIFVAVGPGLGKNLCHNNRWRHHRQKQNNGCFRVRAVVATCEVHLKAANAHTKKHNAGSMVSDGLAVHLPDRQAGSSYSLARRTGAAQVTGNVIKLEAWSLTRQINQLLHVETDRHREGGMERERETLSLHQVD